MLADENAAGTLGPPEPAPRRTYWPIALLLGGLVVAMLGAAFVLDQQFRSRVGIEPALSIAGVSLQPTAVAPTIASAPQVVQTAMGAQMAAVTPVPPTAEPSAAPAMSPVAALAVTSPAPKKASDLLMPLHKEIIDTYLRYWTVRIRAFYTLDDSGLAAVMAGDELVRTQQRIADLRSQGRAGRIEVDHNFRILNATPDDALVYDEYVNRSVFVDAATKQDIPTDDPPITRKVSYQIRKLDGIWKVVDGEQHD